MSNGSTKPSDEKGRPPARETQSARAEKSKGAEVKEKTAPSKPPVKVSPPSGALPPALFRWLDWFTFALTTLLVFIGYYYTLAPDLTLEDAGELAVGSFYAGVPHPPGYPVWTIYTWLFTVLVPISNIAWRVALSSAVAGAFASGLLALLVSRGSSMMLEGIADLKNIERRWESGLCMVSGFVSGALLAFNGFMWSQAVIVEVYTFSVLSFLAVLCFLLRWIYAPEQRRYLYWASFLFGVCFTNHQTLIVATMGIEVAVLAAQPKLGRDLFFINSLFYILGLIAKAKGIITSFDNNLPLYVIYNFVGLGSMLVCGIVTLKTKQILTEWKTILIVALVWFAGAAFYFYMPIASMTNPPLNWGYPRTAEGFWHALTRGQYDKTNPTTDIGRFFSQIGMYLEGAVEEFNVVYLLVGLIPFLFFQRLQKRERAWLIGLTAIYLCLAVLLLILLNPSTDRQSREQARVFFTASYVIIAIGIGYGLTLMGGLLATQYEQVFDWPLIGEVGQTRFLALCAGAGAAGIALYALVRMESQFTLDKATAIFALVLALLFVVTIWVSTKRAPLLILLGIFAVMPAYSILTHWSDNEQRGHLFGYWFGHDMFTPPFQGLDRQPIYPEMTRNAILFGGTDPGRFNPTYMIFCESFIPPEKKLDSRFDRRDVYLITQNALADGTYLSYIRAHYNRSAQIDPPFFQEFFRTQRQREEGRSNLVARAFASLDRFFTRLGAKIEKRRRADGIYPRKDNTNDLTLGEALPMGDVGAYYSTEIITPTVQDSQIAFQEYIADAQKRLQHDMQFPNEPKQIKPGEDVRVVDNRISVSGQVAVMAINGLLTKVIFDKNPTNEFFVEESFPLDWMYPYLTPYGIIMKINRQPVPEITEEMVRKDHDFWSQYSQRFTGNWITYDTTVQQICAFAEKTYLRRDFAGFKGDPKFVRDDNAQKAFSKLRSAIGKLYYWHIAQAKSPLENQRMLKEADFAFRQAFAFCPYSPEAVYNYVQLLVNINRVADAELIVQTCLKFDPENPAMQGLAVNLQDIKKGQASALQAQTQVSQVEAQFRASPTNLQLAFQLASLYVQLQRTNQALQLLDQLIAHPKADATTLLSVAQAYAQLGNSVRLEAALQKLVSLMPDNPEAWYDLARSQVVLNKTAPALQSLAKAIQLSQLRLTQQPGAKNLMAEAMNDPTFAALRQNPEFLRLVSPQ